MVYSATFTSQGQISVPAKLRQKLNLSKGRQVIITEEKGGFFVEPVKDLLELKGSLKTNKKPLSNKQLHEVVAQAVADEYAKKLKRLK